MKGVMKVVIFIFITLSYAIGEARHDQLARVLAAKELKVCIWPDYYAITYRNPKTRQLGGIDIDISQALGKELGVAIRYIDSSFILLFDNLLTGRCDIAMHAIGITPQRAAKLQFTVPYLRSDIYAITSKNNRSITRWEDLDLPQHAIAVQAETVMEPIMRDYLKKARLLVIKPPLKREQEVESGRADAFMTDFPYSQRMLDTTDWARLIKPEHTFHVTPYAYALAPGDSSLLERVNLFVEKLRRTGELRSMAKKYKLEPIVIP